MVGGDLASSISYPYCCGEIEKRNAPVNNEDPNLVSKNRRGASYNSESSKYSSSDDEGDSQDDARKRTSASSKVNFSKLSTEEKEARCINMAKKIKKLRRRCRILKGKNRNLKKIVKAAKKAPNNSQTLLHDE